MLSSPRIPQLDGLRGLAILFVLIFHFLWLPNHIGVPMTPIGTFGGWMVALAFSGWVGVELFFVLSGYLITTILITPRRGPHYVRDFFARRGLRILPLFYLLLSLWGLLSWRWPRLTVGGEPGFGWWAALHLSNLRVAKFGWDALPLPLGHIWTLAIEEQFYLVWPLVIWFVPRRWTLLFCALALVGAPLLRMILWQQDAIVAGQTFTFARLDALMWGAGLALLPRPLGARRLRGSLLLSVLIVAYIFVFERGLRGESWWMQTLGLSALSLGFTAGLALTLSQTHSWLNAWWLRRLGRYSYGLYIWHQPICWFVLASGLWTALKPTGFESSFVVRVIYNFSLPFTLTWLVSLASWHLWERPFLRLKRYFGAAA